MPLRAKLRADDGVRRAAAAPLAVRNPEQAPGRTLQAPGGANQLAAGLLQALAEREGAGGAGAAPT